MLGPTAVIEGLHEFFCEWFGGRVPKSVFESEFLPRFSTHLVFIPPAGRYLGLADLGESIRSGYGSNPEFRVQIREVKVLRQLGRHVLVTYEEWQRNALASTPPNNGRIASVLFESGTRLKWVHIHETWLPREVMERDDYDF